MALLLLSSCQSQPTEIPEGLSPAEVFQQAQAASDRGDYSLAVRYYTLYKQKNPDDTERGTWASYEIAFLYHKMKKDDEALVMLDELLALYEKDGKSLPPAPQILAQKLKARLEEAKKEAEKQKK